MVSMECFEVSNIQGLYSDWVSFENHSTDSFITATRQHFSPQYILYIYIFLLYHITLHILYIKYIIPIYIPIVPYNMYMPLKVFPMGNIIYYIVKNI